MSYNPTQFTVKIVAADRHWALKFVDKTSINAPQVVHFDDIVTQLDQMQVEQLLIDLSEADVIDSSGLRLLLEAKQELDKRDITLVLQNPSEHLRRLFRVIQFDQIFSIEQGVDDESRLSD